MRRSALPSCTILALAAMATGCSSASRPTAPAAATATSARAPAVGGSAGLGDGGSLAAADDLGWQMVRHAHQSAALDQAHARAVAQRTR